MDWTLGNHLSIQIPDIIEGRSYLNMLLIAVIPWGGVYFYKTTVFVLGVTLTSGIFHLTPTIFYWGSPLFLKCSIYLKGSNCLIVSTIKLFCPCQHFWPRQQWEQAKWSFWNPNWVLLNKLFWQVNEEDHLRFGWLLSIYVAEVEENRPIKFHSNCPF